MNTLKGPWKHLASLRLAICVIVAMAIISAVGTITEARYSAEVAQKLVYQSIWMYIVMGTLIVTLIAVMIDRLPWKQHHAGFVMAHIGIITLLFGAWLTQKYGVDGSVEFQPGESRHGILTKDQELLVYSTLDGTSFRPMYQADVDFLRHPIDAQHPYVVHLGKDDLIFSRYEHFAFRESEIQPTQAENDGPAIRFQLENPNANLTEWLRRESHSPANEIDLGPAKVILASEEAPKPNLRNEVVLITKKDSPELDYIIYNKDNTVRKKGHVKQSDTVETGWMGMKFRLLRYLPHSKEIITFTPSPTASPASSPALKFSFRGAEHWIGLDSALKLYMDDRMFVVSYGHKQLELAFPLKLIKFHVGMDQGSDHPASYESLVDVPGRGETTISMNEPLKFQGFTFYQSSFEKDPKTGEPTASILSVNHDPGRWVKYVGSMMIVFGSVILFYFKRVQWLKAAKK